MDNSIANLPTHPALILYALTVYGYCLAAEKTKTDIQSNDPTANGLFYSTEANYKTLQTYDTTETRDADEDLDDIINGLDPEIAETYRKAMEENETPQAGEESSDIEQRDYDPAMGT
jgi:hypothetical protein